MIKDGNSCSIDDNLVIDVTLLLDNPGYAVHCKSAEDAQQFVNYVINHMPSFSDGWSDASIAIIRLSPSMTTISRCSLLCRVVVMQTFVPRLQRRSCSTMPMAMLLVAWQWVSLRMLCTL